jgi:uncharacterized protein (UPF0218 family)
LVAVPSPGAKAPILGNKQNDIQKLPDTVVTASIEDSIPTARHNLWDYVFHPFNPPVRDQRALNRALVDQTRRDGSELRQELATDLKTKLDEINNDKASTAADKETRIVAAREELKSEVAGIPAALKAKDERIRRKDQVQRDRKYDAEILVSLDAVTRNYKGSYIVYGSPRQGAVYRVSRKEQLAREAGVRPQAVTDVVVEDYFKRFQPWKALDAEARAQALKPVREKLKGAKPTETNVERRFIHDGFVEYLRKTLGGKSG